MKIEDCQLDGLWTAMMALGLACGTTSPAAGQDSLRVRVLSHEIEQAEVRVAATSFWRRAMPTIHLSASFGMKDALIYDSATSMLYPRDSYRLTIGFPLHELFRSEQHQEAAIRLRRLRDEKEMAEKELAKTRQQKLDRAAGAYREITILTAELHLLREIVRYNEALFQQGRVTFDVLARAKLQVLQTERQILHIQTDQERENNAMDRM